ncbi:MAG TPA: hypothetical protein VGV38_06765 [Pyrinomonadaceae bacterium]|nr:hypothetical protein [Pyrinomonadaceae bacterium]
MDTERGDEFAGEQPDTKARDDRASGEGRRPYDEDAGGALEAGGQPAEGELSAAAESPDEGQTRGDDRPIIISPDNPGNP